MNSTIDQQIQELRREVKRRKKIYPHLIEAEKLTEQQALVSINLMQDALETLTQLRGLVRTVPLQEIK